MSIRRLRLGFRSGLVTSLTALFLTLSGFGLFAHDAAAFGSAPSADPPSADPIWACAQSRTGALRLAKGPEDCGRNEHLVNLNDEGDPLDLCAKLDDGRLRLGSGTEGCRDSEQYLQSPGDVAIDLCYRLRDGNLRLAIGGCTFDEGSIQVPAVSATSKGDGIDVNQPPQAVDDSATTPTATPVVINVLANDFDPDLDPVFVSAVGQPTNGTAVINADLTITYTPAGTFSGTATFTYTLDDGRGGTDSATVTVTVGESASVIDPAVGVDSGE